MTRAPNATDRSNFGCRSGEIRDPRVDSNSRGLGFGGICDDMGDMGGLCIAFWDSFPVACERLFQKQTAKSLDVYICFSFLDHLAYLG